MTLNIQEDIWTIIQKYLSPLDNTMISCVSTDYLRQNKKSQNYRTVDIAARNGYKGIVKWCRKSGHDITSKTSNAAVKSGNLKLVQWMEKNMFPRSLRTLLNSAAKRGHLNILKWWATSRCYRADDESLYIATTHGHLRIVKWFFWTERANNRDDKFIKVLDIAVKQHHDDILKWCIKYNCSISTDIFSVVLERGDYELTKIIVQHAKYLLTKFSSAMYAAKGNNIKVLKYVVKNGAELERYYPLSRAIKNNNYEMVKWMVENGAAIDEYLLEDARKLENKEIYNYLIEI